MLQAVVGDRDLEQLQISEVPLERNPVAYSCGYLMPAEDAALLVEQKNLRLHLKLE